MPPKAARFRPGLIFVSTSFQSSKAGIVLFTARRYASAVLAAALSVRPSVLHKPVLYKNV